MFSDHQKSEVQQQTVNFPKDLRPFEFSGNLDVGVEPTIGGKPPKWMVYNGKPYQNG